LAFSPINHRWGRGGWFGVSQREEWWGWSKSPVLTEALALGYPSRPALFLLRAALKHAISIASYLQGMGNTPDLVGRKSVVIMQEKVWINNLKIVY